MKTAILFAIDEETQETIVSSSQKGSNQVDLIERIPRNTNELLFNAVATLTSATKAPDFDIAIFKAIDKVCQMIYTKHAEKSA